MPWRWFCTDEQLDIPQGLMYAYGLPDYPGRRGGEGLVVDLYADAELTTPWAGCGPTTRASGCCTSRTRTTCSTRLPRYDSGASTGAA